MDISVIVPVYNEIESLKELTTWITNVMNDHGFTYEVLMIDDGSTDGSWNEIEILCSKSNNLKGIRFRRNYGKSAALNKGFELSKGDVVITMDADLQDSPEEIPELFRLIEEEHNDIVSGWKKKRHDPLNKRIPSKLYNWTVRRFTGIKLHDFNCGLKAYKQDVVKSIEVFGEMHRYIPVIAKAAGFKRITEKVVQHQSRKFGVSKYGAERYIKGFLDLLTITFVAKYQKRPMHFFGLLGTLIFIAGFGILAYLSIDKLVYEAYNMTSRPLFFFGIISMIIGTQLFVGGFVAELIGRSSSDRNEYLVSHTTGFGRRQPQNQVRKKAPVQTQNNSKKITTQKASQKGTNSNQKARPQKSNKAHNNIKNNAAVKKEETKEETPNSKPKAASKPQNRRRPQAKKVVKKEETRQQPAEKKTEVKEQK